MRERVSFLLICLFLRAVALALALALAVSVAIYLLTLPIAHRCSLEANDLSLSSSNSTEMINHTVDVKLEIMWETLVYMTHLDYDDTENQMLKKLSKQLNGEDWSWNYLNTLCWETGSLSGSMAEKQVFSYLSLDVFLCVLLILEGRFLVMLICDLLNLCEITKGKR
ncbi:hypothetical protein Nepgr_025333 [Nepenthes gracilis]|uniref:Uncharacterized protein n=1 Tax=Nepenthes gracilis TaxID=150966 RepID=A0AAD3Y0Y7_NEPGR|nr:hypothetical protein Nepgr_025333 [Nepenthes gracilis]